MHGANGQANLVPTGQSLSPYKQACYNAHITGIGNPFVPSSLAREGFGHVRNATSNPLTSRAADRLETIRLRCVSKNHSCNE